ncbi:MutS-related protein [Pedobacter sp.]|uniref:MutS-related protein n=1 Tax=Pedobacter sp. TaxID=1411316 RepID=UPI00396C8DE8
MFKTQSEVLAYYKEQINRCTQQISLFKKQINRHSVARLVAMGIEVLFFVFLLSSKNNTTTVFWSVMLLFPVIGFIVIVKKQNRLISQEEYEQHLKWIFENEVDVLTAQSNGYGNGQDYNSEHHSYSSDLDIFGPGSLYQLINRCATQKGKDELARSLDTEKNKSQIAERQEAIAEMYGIIKNTFEFRAKLKEHDGNKIKLIKQKLNHSLQDQLQFTKNIYLRTYVKIIPYLSFGILIIAIIFGGKFWSLLSLIAILNASLIFGFMKKINQVYFGFSGSSGLISNYADVISWTEEKEWQSPYLARYLSRKNKLSIQIKDLSKIIQAFDARLNMVMIILLNYFFLWDIKCCIDLQKWCNKASDNVVDGLESISHCEEIIAFATLHFNHPEWTSPKIEDDFVFKTEAIGHPLIAPKKCIKNNYEFKTQPTVDIITGSNMAGKSTFLRTIGINMILAYAGANVCANKMQISIFKILTYMRIKDNLNENTSTFKAELDRLKMILANVIAHHNALVLIDEMLRGTNSKDKFSGSKVFIEKMITLKTPTLFATHDLQLSELEDQYTQSIRNYHFDIQISHDEMEFDYLIKNGPCKTFNAAVLLKQIGLDLS